MTPSGRTQSTAAAVAVVGSTTIDDIIGPRGRKVQRVGGVTTYAGLVYRHLGVSTHIVSNIGASEGRIVERLGARGLRLHMGKSPDTTRFVNQFDGDRRLQHMPTAAAPVDQQLLSAVLPRLNWVHLGPLHPADIEAGLLTDLSRWPHPVLLDVQGYTRRVMPGGGRIRAEASGLLPVALGAASLVKANQSEFDVLAASMNTDPRQLMTRFRIDELIITRGSGGGVVWSSTGPTVGYKAATVGRVVDPTGAGDVFTAAYAVGRLVDERPVASAARDAAALAARQVAGGFIQIDY